jgi:4-hydroxybenzoate polyprenyltransferase
MDIVVDLDETLLRTDTLFELIAAGVFHHPRFVFGFRPETLSRRSQFKAALCRAVRLDYATLPRNEQLIAWLESRKALGDRIHLCTATNEVAAQCLAEVVPLFDDVIASSHDENVKGARKAEVLRARFPGGFAYVGDSRADLEVWCVADAIGFAGRNRRVWAKAKALGKPILCEFPAPSLDLRDWAKLLRVHHWAKNILLFVPMILAHAFDPAILAKVVAGFLVVLLATSATYVLNDLADLEADRQHWTKRNRALAGGRLPVLWGLIGAPGAIAIAVLAALVLDVAFAAVLGVYLVGTIAYSFGLKRVPFLDVFIIASLFTTRLVMGVVLSAVRYSSWLVTFSMFFFFGLAVAKRHTEILRADQREMQEIKQRGYVPADEALTLVLGGLRLFNVAIDHVPLSGARSLSGRDLFRTRVVVAHPGGARPAGRQVGRQRGLKGNVRGVFDVVSVVDMRRPAMPSTIRKITCRKTTGVRGKKSAEVDPKN